MPIYIASSIPNAWFPESNKNIVMMSTGISLPEVVNILCNVDHYASYSDNIAPLILKEDVISCVSYTSTGSKISHELWKYAPAYDDYGNELKPIIPLSKKEITPRQGDIIIALLNIISGGSRVAQKGEFFPPTRWVKCLFE